MSKKNLKSRLAKFPPWTLTIICVAAILWMTLAPHPLGEEELPLFPGADKLAHAIMFGGVAVVVLLDLARRNDRPLPRPKTVWCVAAFSSIFGATVEIAQWRMGLGRSFEWSDIIADTAGAFIFSWLWLLLAPRILTD